VGLQSPPQKLPLFKAELGKFVTQSVLLSNPSNMKLEATSQNLNSINFQIIPSKIIIPANDSVEVQIKYYPSNFEIIEYGEIIVQSQKIGNWKFILQGKGLLPSQFDEKVVSSPINEDHAFIIKLRNPFKDHIRVKIELEE
jgi:hypothetical protein